MAARTTSLLLAEGPTQTTQKILTRESRSLALGYQLMGRQLNGEAPRRNMSLFLSLTQNKQQLLRGRKIRSIRISFFESVGLQVELLLLLDVDNQGAVDLANNWSAE